MPVELRKRKAPAPPPPPPPKRQSKAKTATKVKEAVKETTKKAAASAANGAAAVAEKVAAPAAASTGGKPAVGDVISLGKFGGEIETNDGAKTTLKDLVDESKAGVVLFTYPKASTPGCTRQACLFRDSYTPLTASGLSIYGLSTDSPKANTAFKEKQKLPYPLLCDPKATLIGAIGLKKTPKGTTRGVFVVDKSGKVLAAEPGGPEATVNVVKRLVEELGSGGGGGDDVPAVAEAESKEEKPDEKAQAEAKADEEAAPAEAEKKEASEEKPGDDVKADEEKVNGEATAKEDEEMKDAEEKKE